MSKEGRKNHNRNTLIGFGDSIGNGLSQIRTRHRFGSPFRRRLDHVPDGPPVGLTDSPAFVRRWRVRPRYPYTDETHSVYGMQYRVVLEYDPDTGHYTATVPGLPSLFIDAKSEEEALKLAKQGIALYLEELATRPRRGSEGPPKPLPAKVVTVDV